MTLTFFLGRTDYNEAFCGTGHGAADCYQVLFRVYRDYFQTLYRNALVTHLTRHRSQLNYPRRIRAGADAAGCAVKHRAVRTRTAMASVPFNHSLKTFTFADTDNIDDLSGLKLAYRQFLPYLVCVQRLHPHVPGNPESRIKPGFRGVTGLRFIHAVGFDRIKTELDGIMPAVFFGAFLLHHHTRPGLKHGNRYGGPVILEKLYHS